MGRCNSEESRYIFEWVYFWTYNKLFLITFLLLETQFQYFATFNFIYLPNSNIIRKQGYVHSNNHTWLVLRDNLNNNSFIIETQKTNDKSSSQSV
jgi:hypothetical protein